MCVCVCVCAELRSGDGERPDSGAQTRRLGQEPAELHFRPAPQQPVREQVLAAAPQRPADLRGRPHHSRQEPARLAGQVMCSALRLSSSEMLSVSLCDCLDCDMTKCLP